MDNNCTPSTMMSPPKKRSSDLGHLSSNEKQYILNMYKQQLRDEPDEKINMVVFEISKTLVDCLQFILNMTVELTRNKALQYGILWGFTVHAVAVLLQITHFLKTLDFMLFAQYPTFFLSLLACSMIVSIYIQRQKLLHLTSITREEFWEISKGGTETEQYILQRCNHCKIATMILSIAGLVIISALAFEPNDRCNFHYILFAFKQYFPQYGLYFGLFYISTMPFITYVLTGFTLYTLYLVQHGIIQYELVRGLMNERFHTKMNIPRRVLCDLRYQEITFKCLKACVDRHWRVTRFARTCNEACEEVINSLVLVGIAIACCVPAYGIITLQDPCLTAVHHIRNAFLYTSVMLYVVCYTALGQSAKNLTEKWRTDLYNQPWYLWNTKNRQITRLQLMVLEKPICLSAFKLFVIDYALFLQITKWIYSVAALAFKMSEVQKN